MLACRKNDHNDNIKEVKSEEKYPVKFKVSSFTQSITNFTTVKRAVENQISTDSLKKLLSSIACLIVQRNVSSEPIIKNFYQFSATTQDFGVISDSLPYGQYTAYFAAVGKGAYLKPSIYSTSIRPSIFDYMPDVSFMTHVGTETYDVSNSDAFVADSINFSVDGVTNNQDLTVNFKRIVGLLQLVIEDDNPELNIDSYVNSEDIASKYIFKTGKAIQMGYDYAFVTKSLTKISNGDYQIYQPYTDHPFSVYIDQYGPDGTTVVHSKKIDNVICKPNQITILSGKFGDDTGETDLTSWFKINIDTNWGSDTTRIRF